MIIYNSKDYKDGLVRIKPEGWVDEIVFETKDFHSCGQAQLGMGIRINDGGSGVLTLDDMIRIYDVIRDHMAKVGTEVNKLHESDTL